MWGGTAGSGTRRWPVTMGVLLASALVVAAVVTVHQWAAMGTSQGTALAAWIAVAGVMLNNLVSWRLEAARSERAEESRRADEAAERRRRFSDSRREAYQNCLEDIRALAEASNRDLEAQRGAAADEEARRLHAAAMAWPHKVQLISTDHRVDVACSALAAAAREYRTARRQHLAAKDGGPERRERAKADYVEAMAAFIAAARADLQLPSAPD